MPARYSFYIPVLSLLGDFLILNYLFVVRFCQFSGGGICMSPAYLLFFTYLNLAWFILVLVFGAHRPERNTQKKQVLFTYIRIIVFFFFLFLMFFQITPFAYFPRSFIKYLFPSFFIMLMVYKFGLYYLFLLYRKWGLDPRCVIIIGKNANTQHLVQYLKENRWHGYRLLGCFDESMEAEGNPQSSWSGLRAFLDRHPVHEVYIAANNLSPESFEAAIELIGDYPVHASLLPDMGTFAFKTAELIHYGPIPVIRIHPGPLRYWYNRLIKRSFDLVFSLVMIFGVLSWMIPLLYLMQLFGSRQGVFFRQQRTSLQGNTFSCIKFRTMYINSEADIRQAADNDPRITSLGGFLRKYSLDELPQFLNVFAGQMSVVGPRPHMLRHTDEYRRVVKRFMLRHTVKPGITGLAQVSGARGEIKNKAAIEKRVEFDVQYIENWSFNMDLKIMAITIWLILSGRAS